MHHGKGKTVGGQGEKSEPAGFVVPHTGGGDALDRQAYCPLVDCPRLSRLQAALRETIEVFEETRSSFKSKRLEVMRKRLIDILAGS